MSVFERTGAALEGSVTWVRQRLAVRADRRAGVQAAQQRGALLGAPRQTVDLEGDDSGAPLIRPARLNGRAARPEVGDIGDVLATDGPAARRGARGAAARDEGVGGFAPAAPAGLDALPAGSGAPASGDAGDADGLDAHPADGSTSSRSGLFGSLLDRVSVVTGLGAGRAGAAPAAGHDGAREPTIAGFADDADEEAFWSGAVHDEEDAAAARARGGCLAGMNPAGGHAGNDHGDAGRAGAGARAGASRTGAFGPAPAPGGNATYVGQTVGTQRETIREATTVAKPQPAPVYRHDGDDSVLPDLALLDAPPATVETMSPETLEYTSRLIEKKLSDFGISATVVHAYPGPVITRYEIEPATGVKGAQIVNLAKDLARSLSVISLRVVETIPGKNLMGLELPNPRRQGVRLSEIIGSRAYVDAKSPVTISLGKDIAGNPVVADLAKMPHLLVAGTTGSGKSVGINAMLMSILYKADPSQVRMIMIDPKMLEMSVYEGIPHLLAPVVTDMRQAGHALNWCVGEMERRYKLMSKLGVRNLAGYNAKIAEAEKREELIPNPFSLTPDAPEPLSKLPIIVVVIDELADLMMVVGKKIEELIARLAQKARAAGIHLILATQRPSVDVITGLIKANIPSRIAFQVSSKIDSRTILDQMGAETLLGQGDMLFLPAGTSLPQRVHGAYVADEEVHKVVASWKEVGGEPDYIEGILEGGVPEETNTGSAVGFGGLSSTLAEAGMDGESDAMYDQAVAVVLQHRRASISLVQRHLRIGYNRAARLLEQMERSGIVSPMQNNGNRDILVPAAGAAREGE